MQNEEAKRQVSDRWLSIDEIRLVCDLRIMHSKVDEIYAYVESMRRKHGESDIVGYADYPVLEEDIRKMDEVYLWFVKLKEEMEHKNGD